MLANTNRNTEIEITDQRPLDQNPAAVYLASLKESGRRSQRQALNVIANMLGYPDCFSVPWAALRYQHTQAIRTQLQARYNSPATVNRFLCALRRTLKEARRLGLFDGKQDDYARAVDLDTVKGETLPAGRSLSSGELAALMRVCAEDKTPAGVRDAAILALAYTCGLRRDELANLERENYNPEMPTPDMGELKILTAKRGKQRTVYPTNGAYDALADWLDVRGDEPGPLFWAIRKGGHPQPGGMKDTAIYTIMQKRAKQAGVKHFSPHDLRRTFVGDALDAGIDIATVAGMAGHADTKTTGRYDRRGERAKQTAAGKLHIPYTRRTN